MSPSWQQTSLESLEVGATPLVRHFLQRLQLAPLFEHYLPPLPGRQPALSSAVTLTLLVTNLLLARRPLYALPAWVARRVPEHLGLPPGQAALLNDDRLGRALDHLQKADRASLLTALVVIYVVGGSIQQQGIGLALALGGMGTAIVIWAVALIEAPIEIEERHSFATGREHAVVVDSGTGTQEISRRRFLARLLAGDTLAGVMSQSVLHFV